MDTSNIAQTNKRMPTERPIQMPSCTTEYQSRKRLRTKTTLETNTEIPQMEDASNVEMPLAAAALGLIGVGLRLSAAHHETEGANTDGNDCTEHIAEAGDMSKPSASDNEHAIISVVSAVRAERLSSASPAKRMRADLPVTSEPKSCTKTSHLCGLDHTRGCSFCHYTCHDACNSPLCVFEECQLCLPIGIIIPINSPECTECQIQLGCHACHREGCHATSPMCYAKCTAWPNVKHVCPSVRSGSGGCDNCGHLCHKSNADPRCTYYERVAGQLPWQATAQELLDTQAGTQGSVPHMTQVSWRWHGLGSVMVDGTVYDVGYGNPGGYNDCLIDSVRQCFSLDTDCRKVRHHLVSLFADAADDRAQVTSNSYLNLDSHWKELLQALFGFTTCGANPACDLASFCIIALYRDNVNNGLVVGDIRAPKRVVVMNTSDIHFDPCLPR